MLKIIKVEILGENHSEGQLEIDDNYTNEEIEKVVQTAVAIILSERLDLIYNKEEFQKIILNSLSMKGYSLKAHEEMKNTESYKKIKIIVKDYNLPNTAEELFSN